MRVTRGPWSEGRPSSETPPPGRTRLGPAAPPPEPTPATPPPPRKPGQDILQWIRERARWLGLQVPDEPELEPGPTRARRAKPFEQRLDEIYGRDREPGEDDD